MYDRLHFPNYMSLSYLLSLRPLSFFPNPSILERRLCILLTTFDTISTAFWILSSPRCTHTYPILYINVYIHLPVIEFYIASSSHQQTELEDM